MRAARRITLAAFALLAASALEAQDCKASNRPYFEFQVPVSAEFTGDSAVRPRPVAKAAGRRSDDADAFIVQFVVDTLGRPVATTFKVLRAPSEAAGDSVRAVLPLWRFTPARVGLCNVPLLFQTWVTR